MSDFAYITDISLSYFRLFKQLEIHNITNKHVLMGPNGAGKTTVLWAILLTLRAYNTRVVSSSLRDSELVNVTPSEIAELVNYPGLLYADAKANFIHSPEVQGQTPTEVSLVVNGSTFTCKYGGNGKLTLSPWIGTPPTEKVRFAFIASEAYLEAAGREIYVGPIMSSSLPNIRSRFRLLSQDHRDEIVQHLKALFDINNLQQVDPEIFVIKGASKTELIFMGSAFRKVFTALVMVYSLVGASEKSRVLLVEEMEAQLYPTIQQLFLEILARIIAQHHIQLIMTSNSEQILHVFTKNEIFVLMYPQTSHHIGRRPWLAEAVSTHLLAIQPVKPLIVCEGSDDKFFVTTVAKLIGLHPEDVQFHSSASLCSSEDLRLSFENVLKESNKRPALRYLRDLDFRVDFNSGFSPATSEFFWDLPTIESYIFVDYCENHKNDAVSPLAFLVQHEFATAYANCFRSQNRDDSKFWKMFTYWGDAMKAATQSPPTSDGIRAVAKVVRGHNWVNDVLHETTMALISGLTTSILVNNPTLEPQIRTLFKYVLFPKKN